ncbi:hypothetical protein BB561_003960 [Smittium simulii]|uniref:Uncharacterized protein n=1 Tax=Smittium simulii TaxID=133385 RepID=A0A2T9YIS1_9FUNG|nr:hypothetical protein BB561_003960 [Smittium simulii]
MSRKVSNAIIKEVAALLAKGAIEQINDLSKSRGRFYAHFDTPDLQKISLFSIKWEDLLILCTHIWTLTESYAFKKCKELMTKTKIKEFIKQITIRENKLIEKLTAST